MKASHDETRLFPVTNGKAKPTTKQILTLVRGALEEKGYRAVDQIVGYLISGDPAYITSHGDARLLIRRLERDELLEDIVQFYLDHHE